MNNFFIYILFFFTISCDNNNQDIIIKQSNIQQNIIIQSSVKNKTDIVSIRFPKKLTLKNSSNSNFNFKTIDYKYSDSLSNWANRNIRLYRFENDSLIKTSNFKSKKIEAKQNSDYIFYTMHIINSDENIQRQFDSYVEKMLLENKDTLHIGTVKEFKKEHKELFEQLTKGDSISIQFLDGKALGEKITIPVKW